MQMWRTIPVKEDLNLLGIDISTGYARDNLESLAWPMFLDSIGKFAPEHTDTILHNGDTLLLTTNGDNWVRGMDTLFSDILNRKDRTIIFICVAEPSAAVTRQLVNVASIGYIYPVLFVVSKMTKVFSGEQFNDLKAVLPKDRISLYYVEEGV